MNRLHQTLKRPEENFYEKKEHILIADGHKRALNIFQEAAIRVPAYKDFLKKNKISPEKIQTYQDMEFIPPVNKKNYIYEYPLEMLCWDGTLTDKALTFAVTSGSTGKPAYFPRDDSLDFQSSVMHEIFLKNINGEKVPSTLVINGFCMGIWIGGLITYQAFHKIALRKGYPIAIICPAMDKKETFEAIQSLHSQFEQIILCGYPPFVKDLLEEGIDIGIDWKSMNLKFIFAAEAFSQEYREFIIRTAGIKNPYRSMTNIYGTNDLGTMAMETPISILIRDMAYHEPILRENIFPGVNRTPTLAQFNPEFIQFDTIDNEILCTSYNALPLIRYAIGDHGGIIQFSKLNEIVKKHSMNMENEISRFKIHDTLLEWPFVYVYERSDFTIKLQGVLIYPEHLREAILDPAVEPFLTGKFTMETKSDEENNQYFEVNIELKKSIEDSSHIKNLTKQLIVERLIKKNDVYRSFAASMKPGRLDPRINFFPYGDDLYFKSGTKHKWVRK